MASPCSRGDSPCRGGENAAAKPPAPFSPVFLAGEVEKKKKKQMFRKKRGAPPFPAAEAGSWRVGRGKNRAGTLSSSPGGASALPAAGSPEPKEGN